MVALAARGTGLLALGTLFTGALVALPQAAADCHTTVPGCSPSSYPATADPPGCHWHPCYWTGTPDIHWSGQSWVDFGLTPQAPGGDGEPYGVGDPGTLVWQASWGAGDPGSKAVSVRIPNPPSQLNFPGFLPPDVPQWTSVVQDGAPAAPVPWDFQVLASPSASVALMTLVEVPGGAHVEAVRDLQVDFELTVGPADPRDKSPTEVHNGVVHILVREAAAATIGDDVPGPAFGFVALALAASVAVLRRKQALPTVAAP